MPQTKVMQNDNHDHDLAWSIALVAVGLLFLIGSQYIKSSVLVGNNDPGPRAVPIVMSCILIGGGIGSLCIAWWSRDPNSRRDESSPPTRLFTSHRRVFLFATLSFCYVLSVPFAFYVSTFGFATVSVWSLGAKWWTAIVVASSITMVVWGLFVRLFLVPLPTLLETISRM